MRFLCSLGVLVLLMALAAGIDWRRRGAAATRWREYGFLLIGGLLGAAVGVFNDQITCTISPEYFVYGKEIPAGEGFRLRVAWLGFMAGFSPGAIIAGVYLLANNPKPGRTPLRYRRLLRFVACPLLAAAIAMPLCAVLIRLWDPQNHHGELADLATPAAIDAMLIAWGLHIGLYLGGLLGTVWGVLGIRRAMKTVDYASA